MRFIQVVLSVRAQSYFHCPVRHSRADGWYVHFGYHGRPQQRVIGKYNVDRPLRGTRLGSPELYSLVVAASTMGVPLVSFRVGHLVIPLPEMEQEAGSH